MGSLRFMKLRLSVLVNMCIMSFLRAFLLDGYV